METPALPSKEPVIAPAQTWLLRVSNTFDAMVPGILTALGARLVKRLGREYHLVKLEDSRAWRDEDAACFVRWSMPVEHSWPCSPRETPGFVEKASRALERKFAERGARTVLIGALDPGGGGRYYQNLASNLRGRSLQVFPAEMSRIRNVEELNPDEPVLWGLVGHEGLFCGMGSPRLTDGFYPGGTRFISRNAPGSVSRAGTKIAEALHYLRLHREAPPAGARWLELGASPGGMTSELLARRYRVTAVDRAPLDSRLSGAAGLEFVQADAGAFRPPHGARFDALLCDMNGEARDSIACVNRLAPFLESGALVVFTLKMPGATTMDGVLALHRGVIAAAEPARLRLLARTHLSYNRHEFTLFFEKQGSGA